MKSSPYVVADTNRTRSRFSQYLMPLPDAGVDRVYRECLAAGRRLGANLAAIEAGRRLTQRTLVAKGLNVPAMRAIMDKINGDDLESVQQRRTAHLRRRAAAERRRRSERQQKEEHHVGESASRVGDGGMESLA